MSSSKSTTTKTKKPSNQDLDSRCCQTGCPDCPYGFHEQFNPDVPIELQKKKPHSDLPDDWERYLEMIED